MHANRRLLVQFMPELKSGKSISGALHGILRGYAMKPKKPRDAKLIQKYEQELAVFKPALKSRVSTIRSFMGCPKLPSSE